MRSIAGLRVLSPEGRCRAYPVGVKLFLLMFYPIYFLNFFLCCPLPYSLPSESSAPTLRRGQQPDFFQKYDINIFLFVIFSEFLHEFDRLPRWWVLLNLYLPLALQIETSVRFIYLDT